jgi:hypothetical protein
MIFETEWLIELEDCIFSPEFNSSLKENLPKVFVMYFDNPNPIIKENYEEMEDNDSKKKIIKYVSKEHERALKSRSEGIYSIVAFLVNTFLNYPHL